MSLQLDYPYLYCSRITFPTPLPYQLNCIPMNNIPEFTFKARGDGMASDRHLLETLRQRVFKVRRTDNAPYEWLQWKRYVPERQRFSAFKTVRVQSRGNDGIVQPGPGKPSCEDNYAVTMEGVVRLFDRESLPEWITEQYGYWDEGIVRGVQAVKDDAIVSAAFSRPERRIYRHIRISPLFQSRGEDTSHAPEVFLRSLRDTVVSAYAPGSDDNTAGSFIVDGLLHHSELVLNMFEQSLRRDLQLGPSTSPGTSTSTLATGTFNPASHQSSNAEKQGD